MIADGRRWSQTADVLGTLGFASIDTACVSKSNVVHEGEAIDGEDSMEKPERSDALFGLQEMTWAGRNCVVNERGN
jgi:hypothetical protein